MVQFGTSSYSRSYSIVNLFPCSRFRSNFRGAISEFEMMLFIKDKLNFLIFYSILFLSYVTVNGKVLSKVNVAGKLNNEKISIDRSKLINPKISSEGRNSYPKPDQFYNNIYDYSAGFDSFFNNMNNYPQSSVSYYPFSLQNIDYLYPKIYDRFYPYSSNIMPKSFQSPLDFPAQDNQIPFYRDAQYYEPASDVQVIRHLVPIGYSNQIVSPREAISPVNEVIIDSIPAQDQIPVAPYQNYVPLPLRSAAVDPNFEKMNILLKAMENAAKESSNSTVAYIPTSLQQKVETVARLLILAPSFADEIFKCLAESEAANKFIQTAQNFNARMDEKQQ